MNGFELKQNSHNLIDRIEKENMLLGFYEFKTKHII
jgi:hypothetical protein